MQVIIGNVDVCAIYYVTMIGDILDQVEWIETDDVRVLFANIYSFLDVIFRTNKTNEIDMFLFIFRKKDSIRRWSILFHLPRTK